MGAAEIDVLRAAAATVGVDVAVEAAERIVRHLELLDVWNRRFHLTGERDPRTLLEKHAVDSLAPSRMLPASGPVVDIGSGAGFPGIILGCLRPDLELTMIEPRRRPCSFLGESVRSIPLAHARVLEARAEDAVADLGGTVSVAVSRALRLDVFLGLAKPLLRSGGSAIAMQTPRTDENAASAAARPFGLQLAEIWDYSLPGGGESRRLLRFVPD
jgi:16S rRNA (guanine527-N7)-methyltransferase